MKTFDAHLRIHAFRPPGRCTLRLTLADRRTASATFDREAFRVGQEDGAILGDILYHVLGRARLLVDECLASAEATSSWMTIFLELDESYLVGLPWEGIGRSHHFGRWGQRLRIVRYNKRRVNRLLAPLELPIDVVIVRGATPQRETSGNWQMETRAPTVACSAFKYFQTTRLEGPAVAQRLEQLAAVMTIDIMHLTARPGGSYTGEPVDGLDLYTGEPLLQTPVLARLLARCGTRLLVLDVPEAAPARMFAHRLLTLGGPPILLIPEGRLRENIISEAYLGIVHAEPLDQLFFRHPDLLVDSALFLPEAAAETLSVAAAGIRLSEQARALERIAARLEKGAKLAAPAGLAATRTRLSDLSNHAYGWAHETEGTVPLTRFTADVRHEGQFLVAAHEAARRVVNVWIEYEKAEWSRRTPLLAGKRYELCVEVGRPRQESLVESPRSVPEAILAAGDAEGISAEVAIFTTDFEVATTRAMLRIPSAPRSSDILHIAFDTPEIPHVGRIRIGVYVDQYLLQTVVLDIAIGTPPKRGPAVAATVDFALDSDFVAIELRDRRALNVIVNQNGSGTHSFHVFGTSIEAKFDLGEVELLDRVREARTQLRDIAGADEKQYNFDIQNRGDLATLARHVGGLANFGYALFNDLLCRQKHAFKGVIEGMPPGSIIQVAMTRSAKHVFPWALIYDKPLLRGDDGLHLCEVFQNDLKKARAPGFLAYNECLTKRCPHWDDGQVLCPSGFWGFRHRIEQPLPVIGEVNGLTATDSPRAIDSGRPANVVLGVSLELDHETHHKELSQMASVRIDLRKTRDDIGKGLQRTDAALIYFYCHGGRAGSDVWLGVGLRERMYPTDLTYYKINWPAQHPLVFINGCHTVDVSPDDLLSFRNQFAYCQAAGVLGTEIPVPEPLARAFGRGFMNRFLTHPYPQVGEAILAERLALLERCNVLGLAYTPYCSADLAIRMH
jgi:hypothetical protein